MDAVNSAASASLAAGTEFYFEYQKDIKAGGKEYNYMTTKYLDKVAVDNLSLIHISWSAMNIKRIFVRPLSGSLMSPHLNIG